MHDPFANRRTGILLHPTSLPGNHEQGLLNEEALHFIDFLNSCSVTLWQVLPLGPTHEDGSPYQSYSCFALNPKLLDLNVVRLWNCFSDSEVEKCLKDGEPLTAFYELFEALADNHYRDRFASFQENHQYWLKDYALYRVLKTIHNEQSWLEWPSELKHRHPEALTEVEQNHSRALLAVQLEQFVLYTYWQEIKSHATEKNVAIFGDIPIFVSHDSADVWANQSLFKLDDNGQPITVAGVPPDYFSETGQRWGNPHYNWEAMAAQNYDWWLKRLSHDLDLYDLVRIDHFRGFEAYWEIPANETTAINGRWVKAPGEDLLKLLQTRFEKLPIVAEDLGIITPEVEALRDQFKLPGMKILQFAFDSDANNPYLPHKHEKRSVVYTGTHDNDTTIGWFESTSRTTRDHCLKYLNFPKEQMPWPLIQTALRSVAQLAVIPMQDLLSLGTNDRMNTPGTTEGNWRWRFQWNEIPKDLDQRLRSLNEIYGRSADSWLENKAT